MIGGRLLLLHRLALSGAIRLLRPSGKMEAFILLLMVSGALASAAEGENGIVKVGKYDFNFFPHQSAWWASGANGLTTTRGQEQSPDRKTHPRENIHAKKLIRRGGMEQVGKETLSE